MKKLLLTFLVLTWSFSVLGEECSPEAPVQDFWGACRRCDENVSFRVPYGNFDCDELCPGKRKNRFVTYGASEWDSVQQQYCDLVNCPEGTKRNREGSCIVPKN